MFKTLATAAIVSSQAYAILLAESTQGFNIMNISGVGTGSEPETPKKDNTANLAAEEAKRGEKVIECRVGKKGSYYDERLYEDGAFNMNHGKWYCYSDDYAVKAVCSAEGETLTKEVGSTTQHEICKENQWVPD